MIKFDSIKELLHQGMLNDIVAHNLADMKKLGNLRGGNAGAVVGAKVYGDCPRTTALRLSGAQMPSDEQSHLLMGFGLGNEAVVDKWLKASGIPPEQIKREEEIPVVYNHPSGKLVTGRPDAVILDEQGKPFWGIELKLKGTVYGVSNVLHSGKSDTKHIIQAAHYMFKLGLKKYSIVYSVPVRFAVQDRDMAKAKADGVAVLRERDGQPQYYKLGFYEAILELDSENKLSITSLAVGNRPQVRTELKLTEQHISDYYQLVVDLDARKEMPPRPTSGSIIPKQKEWKLCDYCKLKSVCDSYEKGSIDTWFDHAFARVTEEWNIQYPELFDLYINNWGYVES